LVELLNLRGIKGEVTAHATPELVKGKIVIGVLPMHLAVLAHTVGVVDMPLLPAEKRGQELTVDEMEAYGAKISFYKVRRPEYQIWLTEYSDDSCEWELLKSLSEPSDDYLGEQARYAESYLKDYPGEQSPLRVIVLHSGHKASESVASEEVLYEAHGDEDGW
jgi:hypothetical protein